MPKGSADCGTQDVTLWEEAKSHRTIYDSLNSTKTFLFQKRMFLRIPQDSADSGTQNVTLWEEAKSHRTYTLFANFMGNAFANKHAKKKEP